MREVLIDVMNSWIDCYNNNDTIYKYKIHLKDNVMAFICLNSDTFEVSKIRLDSEILIFIDIPTNEEPEFHQWIRLINA